MSGLSRTALATRFKSLVGDSPMHYLRRLRLSRAAGLLATTKRERGKTLGAHRASARDIPELDVVPSAS